MSYLCCFQDSFECCGSSLELSTCLNILTDAVSIGSMVYGLFVIGLNSITGVMMCQKMSSIQRRKYAGTIFVFAMDGVLGLYIVLVGLTKYLTPFGLIHKHHEFRHITCLFGAWLQLSISLSTNAMKAKQAFDYMKLTVSAQLATGTKLVWSQFGWPILIIMISMSLTAFVFLIPLHFDKILADMYPICSILLINRSRGRTLQDVALVILVANILLGVMTNGFIVVVWLKIKTSQKAVEGLGTVVKTGNWVLKLTTGVRMVVRSVVSILANIFGMFIYLFVDGSTVGSVEIPLLLIVVFNSPALINPLTYITTTAAAIINPRKNQLI